MIRAEAEADLDRIDAVTRAAFASYPGAGEPEVALVHALRRAGALAFSLVATEGSDVVGHAAFSPVNIAGVTHWFGLGPVSVLPARQGRGHGATLIVAGLRQLRHRGACGCVVLGDPAYYGRFGFTFGPGLTYGDAAPEHLGALRIAGSAPSGEVSYHPAFSGV